MVLKRCVFFGDRVHQIRACGRQAKREKRNLCFRRKSDMWDEANTSSDDITTLQKFAYSIARSCVRLKRCYGVWIGVVFSSFKQTLLGAGEMVRASFPFWSLKQSVSTCLNCFRPRGLKLKKNVIIICGCYAWFAVTWQGGHVGGQYNKQCFEEFIWIWLLVPSGEAILFVITNMAAVTSRANQQCNRSL